MSGPSTSSVRRVVLTGAVAAITATGTWYGAGLKTQQERNQVSGIASVEPFKHILIITKDKKATLEAAATDSRYSHLLNEEEEAIVKDVIKEFLT